MSGGISRNSLVERWITF